MCNFHYDDDGSISVYNDEFPSAPNDLLVPSEDVDLTELYLESNPPKENFLTETSSSSHYSLWSLSTCDEDTPCSSSYSLDEFTSQIM